VDLDSERRDAMLGERCARLPSYHRPDHAPVDDKGGPHHRPKDKRFGNQRDHLAAGPDVVGTRLHRDQDQVGSEQGGARQGGHARWSVEDNVIDAAGDLRRLQMQRLAS